MRRVVRTDGFHVFCVCVLSIMLIISGKTELTFSLMSLIVSVVNNCSDVPCWNASCSFSGIGSSRDNVSATWLFLA